MHTRRQFESTHTSSHTPNSRSMSRYPSPSTFDSSLPAPHIHNICYNIYCAMFHTSISIEYDVHEWQRERVDRGTTRSYDEMLDLKFNFDIAARRCRVLASFRNPIYFLCWFFCARSLCSTTRKELDEWNQSIACWFCAIQRVWRWRSERAKWTSAHAKGGQLSRLVIVYWVEKRVRLTVCLRSHTQNISFS